MPFKNEDAFRVWLETQSHETSIVIAVRAALRFRPFGLNMNFNKERDDWSLNSLRALIIARLSVIETSQRIRAAAEASFSDFAINTAESFADAAFAAATAALAAAGTATAADITSAVDSHKHISFRIAGFSDSLLFNKNTSNPMAEDLWHGETPPQEFTDAWDMVKAQMGPNTPWDFWRRWLEGFYGPKPRETISFDVQKQIALLPNEDWEQGTEHIVAKIKEIEHEFTLRTNVP